MKRIGIIKIREFVSLRFRRTSKGNQSLFSDIYKDGKRSYEFLKLYLIPELTTQDKLINKAILRKAEMMKARKTWELYCIEESKNTHDEKDKKHSGQTLSSEISLIEWIRKYSSKKLKNGQSDAFSNQINKTIRHLLIYKKKR